MRIDCPCGYSSKAKLGNIEFVFPAVNVYGDVCDHADLCGVEQCRFHYVTREGACRYMREMLKTESSVEARIEDREKAEQFNLLHLIRCNVLLS